MMSAIMRTGQRFGIVQIIDIVTGAKTKRIRQYRHDQVKTYGAGKDKPKKHWSFIMDELLSQEAVVQTTDQYPVIQITPSGKEILFAKKKIFTLVQPERVTQASPVIKKELSCDEALFEKLRILRRNIAREHKIPPYIIFSDKTLREMASSFPVNREEMGRISGVGELKLKNYGKTFIETILAYKEEKPVEEISPVNMETVADNSHDFVYQMREKGEKDTTGIQTPDSDGQSGKKRNRGDSLHESFALLKQGLTVQEVAETRGLAESTITGHLDEWLKTGAEELVIDTYITPERRSRIEAAFLKVRTWKLGPVVRLLKDDGDYEEARIVRGYMQGKGIEFDDENREELIVSCLKIIPEI